MKIVLITNVNNARKSLCQNQGSLHIFSKPIRHKSIVEFATRKLLILNNLKGIKYLHIMKRRELYFVFIAQKVFSLMKIPIKITWKTNMDRKFLIYVYRVFRKLIHFAFFFQIEARNKKDGIYPLIGLLQSPL